MKYIFKYIVNNIKEHKGRICLIIFAVMLSVAALFASSSISKIVQNTYEKMIRYQVGNSDIEISNDGNKAFDFDFLPSQAEYGIKTLQLPGVNEDLDDEAVQVLLYGIDYKELEAFNPQVLYSKVDSLADDEMIISKFVADKYGLKAGDKLKLEVMSKEQTYKIKALSESTGLFATETGYITAIVSYKGCSGILGEKNKATTVFVKQKDGESIDKLKEELKNEYPQLSINDAVDENQVKPLLKMISSCFMMIMALIFFMSVFIILSAVKVTMQQRLSTIGTLRSVGATKKQITVSFLIEHTVYGIIGGLLGSVLGIGILHIVANLANPYKDSGVEPEIIIDVKTLSIAFIAAVILTIISALFPILSCGRRTIKDVMFYNETGAKKSRIASIIFAIVATVACVVFLDKLPTSTLGFLTGIILVLSTMVGFVLLIPIIVNLCIPPFKLICSKIFGQDARVAVCNLRGDKILLNNISILTIAITIVLLISFSIDSAQKQISANFDCYNYNVAITQGLNSAEQLHDIKSMQYVKDAQGVFRKENVSQAQTGSIIKRLDGIENASYLEYMDIGVPDAKKNIDKLSKGKYIMIGDILSYNLKLGVGDTLTLDTEKGEITYEIIEIFETNYILSGLYALISADNFKDDFKSDSFEEIWIKSDNADKTISQIKSDYKQEGVIAVTKEEQEEQFSKFYQNVNEPMEYFAFIAFAIGLLGIVNNFALSFMQRKRSFGVLKSVGMSTNQLKKMLCVEALMIGLIGIALSAILTVIITPAITIITQSMGSVLLVTLDVNTMLLFCALGVVITVLASLLGVKNTKKLNIINIIKYE